VKNWVGKWGPWIFALITVLLSLSGRWHSYNWTREQHEEFSRINDMRLDALELHQRATDRWIDEHNKMVAARTAQLDLLDRDEAVVREAITTMKEDMRQIKEDVRELRRGIPKGGLR
jgi:hypothetical protein